MRLIKTTLEILLVALPFAAGAQTNTWTEQAPIPSAAYGGAVGVINGLIYVAGGTAPALQIYNPGANAWTTGQSMPFSTIYGETGGVINGQLYVAGGQVPAATEVANLEVYDPIEDTWSNLTAMPSSRAAGCGGVINGKLYVAGGITSDSPYSNNNPGLLNTLLVYDPSTNGWSQLAPMPTALLWSGAAVVNGILYVMGGDNFSSAVNTVEAYDPGANTWTARASMPIACEEFNVGVVNGIIYTIGGATNGQGGSALNLVQAYNPVADTWATAPAMPTARVLAEVAVVNGVLYAIGGGNPIVSTNEAFAPSSIFGINMYAGLTITGTVGASYEIEYNNDLNNTNWNILTTVVLPSSPYLFIDTNSTFFSHRFYQAFPLP